MRSLPEKKSDHVRIVMVGDIVGKPGMTIVGSCISDLRRGGCDLIVVNAENAADGAGLTLKQYDQLVAAGVDAITLGDHIYKKREIATVLKTKRTL